MSGLGTAPRRLVQAPSAGAAIPHLLAVIPLP